MHPISVSLNPAVPAVPPMLGGPGAEWATVGAGPHRVLAQQEEAAPNPLGGLFFPMMAIMLLFYFMFLRPQQTKQRRYEEMIESLKENDQVVTTGGIHGVITGVQRDQNRVTLRVDDATGAKLRVGLWAISHLVGEDKDDKAGASVKRNEAKKNESKNKK